MKLLRDTITSSFFDFETNIEKLRVDNILMVLLYHDLHGLKITFNISQLSQLVVFNQTNTIKQDH